MTNVGTKIENRVSVGESEFTTIASLEFAPGVYFVEASVEILDGAFSGSAVMCFKNNLATNYDQTNSVSARFDATYPVMARTLIIKTEIAQTFYLRLLQKGLSTAEANGNIRYVRLSQLS